MGGRGGGREREGHHQQHQNRRSAEGQGPAVAASKNEASRPDGEHGASVAQVCGGGTCSPFRLRQQIGAVGIDQYVLGGTHHG